MELYYIILGISIIFVAYFAFLYFTRSTDMKSENMVDLPASEPIQAPTPQPQLQPKKVRMQEQQPEEQPMNEYEDNHESADIPENMRNPERMFRPAPDNHEVPQSGMMGVPMGAGYEREPVMNEGEFMPGIMAYETDGPKNFSMF